MIIRKIRIKCYICTKWYILEVLVQFQKLDWKINCNFQIIREWITDIVRRFRKTFRIPAILPANHHKWRHNHHMRWPNSFLNLYLISFILVFIYYILLYLIIYLVIIIIIIWLILFLLIKLLTFIFVVDLFLFDFAFLAGLRQFQRRDFFLLHLLEAFSRCLDTLQSNPCSSIHRPYPSSTHLATLSPTIHFAPSLAARELSISFSPASAITTLQQAVSGSLFQPAYLHRDHPYLSSCNLAEIFLGF